MFIPTTRLCEEQSTQTKTICTTINKNFDVTGRIQISEMFKGKKLNKTSDQKRTFIVDGVSRELSYRNYKNLKVEPR